MVGIPLFRVDNLDNLVSDPWITKVGIHLALIYLPWVIKVLAHLPWLIKVPFHLPWIIGSGSPTPDN